ncbi:MAG: hypothetical protein IJK31_06855 [Ruminococcus sp.]|nr:hypothetical protein [Ruminococcus sp.]
MNNKELDLDILENSDKETVDRLSAEYKALTENDVKRLYTKSEKMYRERVSGREQTAEVSGVEAYRRPVWRRVLAIASALLIIAGAGAGGAFVFRNMKDKPDKNLTEGEVTSAEDVTVTDALETTVITQESTEDVSAGSEPDMEVPQKKYRELQLHELITVDTMDEAEAMVRENFIESSIQDRYGIDVERYVDEIINADDLDTLEIKSFIYHMMLNSVDYYNTVKGTAVCDDGLNFSRMEFQSDINAQESYIRYSDKDGAVTQEDYYLDNKKYALLNDEEVRDKCIMDPYGNQALFSIGHPDDNYRSIIINSNDHGLTSNRNDITELSCRASELLLPQSIATFYMRDFDNWKIEEYSETDGFRTVRISGNTNENRAFSAVVDADHGIILKLHTTQDDYDEDLYFEDIEVDVPVERKEPDLTGRELVTLIYGPNGFEYIPYTEESSGVLYSESETSASE